MIEAMIDNNMRQMKADNARAGAEIERECALRDIALDAANLEATDQLAAIGLRLAVLDEERRRLIAEREWLNNALLEFEDRADADRSPMKGRLS